MIHLLLLLPLLLRLHYCNSHCNCNCLPLYKNNVVSTEQKHNKKKSKEINEWNAAKQKKLEQTNEWTNDRMNEKSFTFFSLFLFFAFFLNKKQNIAKYAVYVCIVHNMCSNALLLAHTIFTRRSRKFNWCYWYRGTEKHYKWIWNSWNHNQNHCPLYTIYRKWLVKFWLL